MPLRMRLEMDDCVNPFAPAVKAFAHPKGGMAGALFKVRRSRSDEIAEVFVLEGEGLQSAE